jgi:hypothetical protein
MGKTCFPEKIREVGDMKGTGNDFLFELLKGIFGRVDEHQLKHHINTFADMLAGRIAYSLNAYLGLTLEEKIKRAVREVLQEELHADQIRKRKE